VTAPRPPYPMQLPPPDLAGAYASWPEVWQLGAVEVARRLLAAAYAHDVQTTADRVATDLRDGAVRGMTLSEYVEDECAAHRRVTDYRLALDVLAHSPNAPQPPAEELVPMPDRAALLFRLDVEDALAAMGIAVDDER